MRRTKEDAQKTREALLEAALAVFGDKGFTRTTLSDIAKRAGLTRGALYWHFESKEQLYGELLGLIAKPIEAELREILSTAPPADVALQRFFERWFSLIECDTRFRAVVEIIFEKTELVPELAERDRQDTDELIDAICFIIGHGMKTGVFRADLDAQRAGTAFYAYLMGITGVWLEGRGYEAGEDAAAFVEIFIRGLR